MSRGDPLRVRVYLEHISQAIANIREYTAGMDAAACNNVAKHHPEFAARHAEIPWNFAYEMRNALAHGYFKVDHGIVWRTIEADLPALNETLSAALNSLPPA